MIHDTFQVTQTNMTWLTLCALPFFCGNVLRNVLPPSFEQNETLTSCTPQIMNVFFIFMIKRKLNTDKSCRAVWGVPQFLVQLSDTQHPELKKTEVTACSLSYYKWAHVKIFFSWIASCKGGIFSISLKVERVFYTCMCKNAVTSAYSCVWISPCKNWLHMDVYSVLH